MARPKGIPETKPRKPGRKTGEDPKGYTDLPGFVHHLTKRGEKVAKFYMDVIEGRVDPTDKQMAAAKELASWGWSKPTPPPVAIQNNLHLHPLMLRVAGATDDELKDLALPPPDVPSEVLDADFRDVLAPGAEVPQDEGDFDDEGDWDDEEDEE